MAEVGMNRVLSVTLIASLLPAVASGQSIPYANLSHRDVVEQVKADLVARHVDLSGPCGAFQITRRVAWKLRGEGAGVLSKPSGNNCQGFAVDIVVYPNGVHYDMLYDSGRANNPQWLLVINPSTSGPLLVDPARWRAPANPDPLPSLISRTPTVLLPHDYDGDRKADVTVYRASAHTWFSFLSGTQSQATLPTGGQGPERPVPADYDGDGKTDPAVYRESTGEWVILRSSTLTVQVVAMGAPALGDLPVPADYDGDGQADLAVYRSTSGEWFILQSTTHVVRSVRWGAPALGDLPVPTDYDGDGRADIAVYRRSTGEWFISQSATGVLGYARWGSPVSGDFPVPADYDGDGRADIAVYRATTGQWLLRQTRSGNATFNWGAPQLGDIPVPADYDGDGRADVAVYRFSTAQWLIRLSSTLSLNQRTFGQPDSDAVRPY